MTDEVSAVARAIVSCTRCPRLVAWRTETAGPAGVGSPVAGFGDPQAGVFLLGMATAAAGGNCTGRAFTGNRSARTLVAALHRAGFANQPTSEHVGDGLRLDRAWMASAVRCPPPGNRPLAAERDACLGHLRAELAALGRVRVVVCLGVFAWDAALRCVDADPRPRFRHGREHVGPDGLVVLGCYHPSPQNTATGLLTPPDARRGAAPGAGTDGLRPPCAAYAAPTACSFPSSARITAHLHQGIPAFGPR